jgi:Flp pilus assembly pilin Flp
MTYREKAQGLVEYGLIIALVALLAIGGLVLLGPLMGNLFSSMTGSV